MFIKCIAASKTKNEDQNCIAASKTKKIKTVTKELK